MRGDAELRAGYRWKELRRALMEIATPGCERLTGTSECRGATGYPRNEWCPQCIAADALGIPAARPPKVETDAA